MRLAETELHLRVNLSGSELTVNGLVEVLDRLEGELIASLLDAVQVEHLEAVRAGEAPPIRCPRCGSERWVKRGTRPRQLTTQRGEVEFALRQVTCKGCDRTWSPYRERLGLEPYQRATEGLRRPLAGLALETSYGKANRWGEETLGATLSPMTLWRTVQERGQRVEYTAAPGEADRLELDGTQVPVRRTKRGKPVHLAFAVGERDSRRCRQKRLVGVGLGAGRWPDAVPEALTPELVVHDGERGLGPMVARRYPEARAQRCAWHLVHRLDHKLWRDGWPKEDRDRRAAELREHVFGPEPPDATRRVVLHQWAEKHFAPGSPGHRYIERALEDVGYAEPSTLRTTAHAERAMRELNRRTDVGAPWTLEGIGNLLRLRLARRHNPDDYDAVWDDDNSSDITLEAQAARPPMSRP